ncbi:hypothetical protein SCLCIDRAFT_34464 [Scleroderma citrinum Foug A]|uniref:Uncharacterized protein n=1 Tax=Scleroderma citrinum Foug A TaxID=1036808 RepID=A0A0C3D2C6_9AGAM|nr:hypothetical protein SCLCIDRAFT_34464 [Scleroderma citrinum Foug A]
MNTSPRGREKHKKVRTTTEEGEEDDDTKEVFGVPRAMVEEQRDVLGMLTQMLAQVAERLAAMEALIMRRAVDQDKERLELERVRTSLSQQHTEDLWRMGTLMGTPFVYSSKGKEKETEAGEGAEEKGEEADNEDKDVQGKEDM